MKTIFVFIIICILITSLFIWNFGVSRETKEEEPDFFLGISPAYADTDEIKALIDKVSPFTNFFAIGSTGISHIESKLDETCKYIVDKNMDFIVFVDSHPRLQLIANVTKKYNDNFKGIYFDDEQGGRQLDKFEYRWVNEGEAETCTEAAIQYVYHLHYWLNMKEWRDRNFSYAPSDFKLFTADYTLYWFNYLAGYDVIFAEFGWNYSRQINVALNRGAATVLKRDWGVIVAWTYEDPPYIESGEELYDDLIYAYDNGAKYVLIFDSNENYTGSILKEEHFDAIEKFWKYTQENPREEKNNEDRVAFVLPKDFGYGFRGPEDKIWGLWEADTTSLEISYHLGEFLKQYGINLDIIYDDMLTINELPYRKYIYWNGTIIEK
ncbi:MAG: hypothetical protein P8Y18_07585 [Candidatus Bathyarchaeota archaeon]